jgi:hypothetical protein
MVLGSAASSRNSKVWIRKEMLDSGFGISDAVISIKLILDSEVKLEN